MKLPSKKLLVHLTRIVAIISCLFAANTNATTPGTDSRTESIAVSPLISDNYDSPQNWRQPVAPFQIADHTWYIGSEGLSAILIRTKQGAVLIDGGLPGAAQMLIDHMHQLGVSPTELKYLLPSHAHFDHAGPFAELRQLTGAQVATNAETATLLARGDKGDIHFDDKYPFPPVTTDRFLMDGEVIDLGGLQITAHFTPGHTPGTISWTWDDSRNGKKVRIAYLDSLTAPGYQIKNNPRYPHLADDFRHSVKVMQELSCDLVITPHPEGSGWNPVDPKPSLDHPMTCKSYAYSGSGF